MLFYTLAQLQRGGWKLHPLQPLRQEGGWGLLLGGGKLHFLGLNVGLLHCRRVFQALMYCIDGEGVLAPSAVAHC